ncbi:MAG: hypothetical protein HOM44_17885 [Gammaproteobacteria bacterium]|jgi:hypothetical protein|nr:hypothetical protein [Gammaproteobacteria bacterium]MBT5155961.1 hypothetical protein [Gammaproteobacteria bacterium]MBT6890685.1 hypothetical protein [Gammaproteobacteria bacterium]
MSFRYEPTLRPWRYSPLACLLLLPFSAALWAQNVPSDLLDLSLEQLFATDVVDTNSDNSSTKSKWSLRYKFQRADFEGFNKGTDRLSNDEVLFTPGLEPRTDDNFPVVPTTITQKVHALVVGYQLNEQLNINLTVPYVKQSTDHISIVPSYADFTIRSSGIGDVAIIGSYQLKTPGEGNLQLSLGLSFPTGSIDKEGDTPRAPGNQQLPYSMQLGSGTYDIPASIHYSVMGNGFGWGTELAARIRLGENDRDYTLGNRVSAATWLKFDQLAWVKPSIKVIYEYSDSIDGKDIDLMVPSAFPYPASVTNPKMYGGKQAIVVLGFKIPVFATGNYVELEIGKPFYESLNGPQTREDIRYGFKFNLSI